MPPITFNNVAQLNTKGFASGLASANKQITSGFDVLNNVVGDLSKQQSADNTAAYLQEIHDIDNFDNLDVARESGKYDANALSGRNIDAQKIISAIGNREGNIRKEVIADDIFKNKMNTIADTPITNDFLAKMRAVKDPTELNQLAAMVPTLGLSPDGQASLMKQVSSFDNTLYNRGRDRKADAREDVVYGRQEEQRTVSEAALNSANATSEQAQEYNQNLINNINGASYDPETGQPIIDPNLNNEQRAYVEQQIQDTAKQFKNPDAEDAATRVFRQALVKSGAFSPEAIVDKVAKFKTLDKNINQLNSETLDNIKANIEVDTFGDKNTLIEAQDNLTAMQQGFAFNKAETKNDKLDALTPTLDKLTDEDSGLNTKHAQELKNVIGKNINKLSSSGLKYALSQAKLSGSWLTSPGSTLQTVINNLANDTSDTTMQNKIRNQKRLVSILQKKLDVRTKESKDKLTKAAKKQFGLHTSNSLYEQYNPTQPNNYKPLDAATANLRKLINPTTKKIMSANISGAEKKSKALWEGVNTYLTTLDDRSLNFDINNESPKGGKIEARFNVLLDKADLSELSNNPEYRNIYKSMLEKFAEQHQTHYNQRKTTTKRNTESLKLSAKEFLATK